MVETWVSKFLEKLNSDSRVKDFFKNFDVSKQRVI